MTAAVRDPWLPLPRTVLATELQEGDFFALTVAEVGTGGWLVIDQPDLDGQDLVVPAHAPAPGVKATLRFEPNAEVILTDGNDLRLSFAAVDYVR